MCLFCGNFKNEKKESGVVLIVCMALLLMLSVIGILSLRTSNTEMDISDNELQSTKAFYLADAGAERAYNVIKDSTNWRAGFTNVQFGEGTYDVVVIDRDSIPSLGNSVKIISIGKSRNAESKVEIKLSRRNPFQYAAFGRDSLILGEESMADSYNSGAGSYAATRTLSGGDLGSNGAITLGEEITVYGDVKTNLANGIVIDPTSSVTGDTSTIAPEVILDPIPPGDITNAQQNNMAPTGLTFGGSGGTYDPITNSLTVNQGGSLTMAGGTYYFSSMTLGEGQDNISSIAIEPGATVIIYVTGNIIIDEEVLINTNGRPGDLQIYSTGDSVTIDEESVIVAALYAPNAQINIIEESDMYGSFIGRAINSQGLDDLEETNFHYDTSLRDLGIGGSFYVSSWHFVR